MNNNIHLGTTTVKSSASNKAETTPTEKSDVDPYYFEIDFTYEEKRFHLVVERYFMLNKSENNTMSEAEVMHQLESIDRFKPAMLTASVLLRKKRNRHRRDFDVWYARQTKIAKKEIIKERLEDRDNGTPLSMHTGITKDDIKAHILSNEELKELYYKYQESIEDADDKKKIVLGVRDDMQARSYVLQSILRNINEDKKIRYAPTERQE